jgi:hypothetical protein
MKARAPSFPKARLLYDLNYLKVRRVHNNKLPLSPELQLISDELRLSFSVFLAKFVFPCTFSLQGPKKMVWSFHTTFWSFHTSFWCVMGRLVHTGLGSSSFVAHVLPYPPPHSQTALY